MGDHGAAVIEHALDGDARRVVVASYVRDALIEAYCRGVGDMRSAVVAAGPLSPDVLDGVCGAAMSALESEGA